MTSERESDQRSERQRERGVTADHTQSQSVCYLPPAVSRSHCQSVTRWHTHTHRRRSKRPPPANSNTTNQQTNENERTNERTNEWTNERPTNFFQCTVHTAFLTQPKQIGGHHAQQRDVCINPHLMDMHVDSTLQGLERSDQLRCLGQECDRFFNLDFFSPELGDNSDFQRCVAVSATVLLPFSHAVRNFPHNSHVVVGCVQCLPLLQSVASKCL